MEQSLVLDVVGDALWRWLIITVAIIMPGLVMGLIVSVFQAATQINEQTLSFLPRLAVTIIALAWMGAWIVSQLSDQFNFMFMNIPEMIR